MDKLIQIQHLLKLNSKTLLRIARLLNSNTTLVKVKCFLSLKIYFIIFHSNTTLVKVKYIPGVEV